MKKVALVFVLVSCSKDAAPEGPRAVVPDRKPQPVTPGPAKTNAVADVLANARRAPSAWDGQRLEVVGRVVLGLGFPALVDPNDETRGLVVHMKDDGPWPLRDKVMTLTCTVHVEPGSDGNAVDLIDCI